MRRRSFDIAFERFRLHGHTRPEALFTFDNHTFTGIQSALDDLHRIAGLSDLHRTHADAVVLIDDGHEIAYLLLIHGDLGNQDGLSGQKEER